MNRDQLIQYYLKRVSVNNLLYQKEKRLLFILSILRLLVFFGGFSIIWIGFARNSAMGIIAVLASVSLFCYLLYLYSYLSGKRDFYNNLIIINNKEATALSGNFSIFGNGAAYVNPSHDFSNDIDLFGTSSLFQYMNRTCTGNGSDILAGWLSDPLVLSDQLANRQKAIKDLSENDNWYQQFLALGMQNPVKKEDIEGLLSWLGENIEFSTGLVQKLTRYFLPLLTFVSFFLLITGLLHYSVFTSLFLINLMLVGVGLKRTNRIHNLVSGKYQFLSTTVSLLQVFNNKTFSSPLLSAMKNELVGSSHSAIRSISGLSKILHSFDSRMNMLVGFVLNGFMLWDFQCIYSLQKWKLQNKDALPAWLNILGQVDALISLANYSFNNSGFVYPEVSEGDTVLAVSSMGHPLINEDVRVCNDFAVPHKGNVVIITGANMAGKSTFLRTAAVNYILAMIGAPVCATSMVFKPVHLFSSMRTTDSLSQNESYFYAELKRLKTLKTLLREEENVFFLLDEILKGTNSTDKSIGSGLFLKKIISLGGTGIIATHDISLGDMEKDYSGKVFNKCFEIEINGENVSFDYKLRNGITQKMNAALLMKQMGITEDDF